MTRVLIVDDDATQLRVLARVFSIRRPDLTVLTSENGVAAVELMSRTDVDLVLTDLQMPRMDGLELLAWMMNHRPSVPVFTMTGYSVAETDAELGSLGAVECFTKPINVNAVLARLTDTLAQSVRGHVQNVSLASFLQLMEMERKTCTLAVKYDDVDGTLFIRQGRLIDAVYGEFRGEEAAIAIIAWPSPSITITSHCAARDHTIDAPLGFIVMEAVRKQDEAARDEIREVDDIGSSWPAAPSGTARPTKEAPEPGSSDALELPSGARAIAIVETATGILRNSIARDGCPISDLARLAAVVLRQELAMLTSSGHSGGVEELVLSTKSRCDVIRPLDGDAAEFVLLVFATQDTNLAMARFELERFLERR